jgi:hypothetical protein
MTEKFKVTDWEFDSEVPVETVLVVHTYDETHEGYDIGKALQALVGASGFNMTIQAVE